MLRPTNEELAEYLTLQAQIKAMTKRLEEIKKEIKKCGSFYTSKYSVSVTTQSRTGIAGLEEVKEFINEEILNKYGLIRKSEYQLVHIGLLPDVSTANA